MLEIRLLGAPEFAYDGRLFRFTALPRAVPLLGWCLLNRRAPLSRDSIAFAFWPDVDEEEARANLRRHLYSIGRALPPRATEPWIIADKKTVGWNPAAPLQFDVVELERLTGSDKTLDRAAALYRGPLLAGYDEPWIEAERQRLGSLLEVALARALERERERAPESALARARRLLELDPWREDALRALLELRHRLGDRAGALREYRTFVERLRAELDVAPMPETTALYEAIAHAETPLRAGPAATAPQPADDRPPLPARLDTLVGREAVLADVTALLAGARCVTLVGTGGVGKTRLALELAWNAASAFPDGAAFVNLATLGDPALVSTAIAAALGIAVATERIDIEPVIATIRTKRLLLVMDNCEHVVAEAARVIAALLNRVPGVEILATSREPLAVGGERVYRVPSLDVPPSFEPLAPEQARGFGSVALFEQRAAAVDPHFELSSANVASVIEICRRLDGIALALELAAARVTVLEPGELARRLDERFRVLGGGDRTALPRQRTMRASIDWSWELSSEAERTLLGRVAIFLGGWTLSGAEAVCFAAPLEIEDPVSLLGALVDRSLVVASRGTQGRRYRLLESIRDYALEKLAVAGEQEVLAGRHARYFAAFGARIESSYETTPDAAWYALATSELDNVRAALRWSFGAGGDTFVGASLAADYAHAWAYGASRGDRDWLETAYQQLDRAAFPELATRLMWQTAAISLDAPQHAAWVAAAVRDCPDARTRAEALRWIAEADIGGGSLEAAEAALDEAGAIDDDVRHPKTHAATLRLRAELASARGDAPSARETFERAIAAAAASGATSVGARALAGRAELAFGAGDVDAAIESAATARAELVQGFGRTLLLATIATRLAAYHLARYDRAAARTFALEALTLAVEFDVPQRFVAPVELLALVAAGENRSERAARFFGFADAVRRSRGLARKAREIPGYDEARAAVTVRLGAAAFAELAAIGACLTEHALAHEAAERDSAPEIAEPARNR